MDAVPYHPLIDHYWKNLFCIHFKIPPDLLKPLLHPSIGVDTWENNAYIGVFGLELYNLNFFRLPLIKQFKYKSIIQLNIRTYVKNLQNEPTVYFFKLNANSRIGCLIAKTIYKLPYIYSSIYYQCAQHEGKMLMFRKNKRHAFSFDIEEDTFTASESPLASFFLERSKFNTTLEKNELYEGIIKHSPFQLQKIKVKESSFSLLEQMSFPSNSMALAHEANFFSKGMRVLLNDFYRVQ